MSDAFFPIAMLTLFAILVSGAVGSCTERSQRMDNCLKYNEAMIHKEAVAHCHATLGIKP